MNSPFPGMDPYLEQHWRDVHTSLVIYARDQLHASLPADLMARVEERVYVEHGDNELRSMYPDVRVVEHGRGGTAVAVQGEVELAEPLIVEVGDESVTEPFIEIREAASGHRLITVIEFISPSNKTPGDGLNLYREKQKELRRGGVSLVEVDLIRNGKHVLSVPLRQIPLKRRTACHAVVRRGWRWSKAEVFSLPLHKKLPAIGVPLREADKDVPLNLQALIDQCYRNGRYYSLDYQIEPDPPLEGEDAAWADALLRSAGRRK